jgi:chemosensory pili system protein ChpA (sensor histidine kinase/response regulator)
MSMPPKIEMIKNFIEEVGSYIPTLINGLESLKKDAEQSEALEESHRLVHTIKGASSLVGLNGLSHIAFYMEEYLEDIIAGKQEFSDEAFNTMQKTVELFREYCLGYMNGGVASRAMLKETVISFRRTRGLSPEDDEQALNELLESVPENEGLSAEEIIDAEKRPEPDSELINQLLAVSAVGTDAIPPFESVPQKDGYPVDAEGRIATTNLQANGSVEIPPELLESFYEEAEEHLEDLGRSLNVLDNQVKEVVPISPILREESRRIRRSVHTLKGAAAVIGFQDFATYAHSLEDLLDWLFEDAREISPEIVTVLAESSDLLAGIINTPQLLYSAKARSLKNQYKKIMGQSHSKNGTMAGESRSDPEQETILKPNEILQAENFTEKNTQTDLFEELSQVDDVAESGARFTKTLRVDMARFDDLVNLSGELIIALSAFDQKMETFTDSVNDLELYRERLKQIARDLEVSYEIEALEQLRAIPDFSVANGAKAMHTGDFDDFDTLELDRYSELNLIIRKLNESAVDVGALHTQLSNLHSEFDGRLTRQRVILSELQDKMMRVRMTPISIITNKLRRTVREIAGNLDKKVNLVVTGEDIELDRLIWEKIADPLMHLLRNAVDHGVEPRDLRQSLGKPSVATIKLEASREGNQVVIRIADDGAGLDYPAIQATVRKMRLSDRVHEMSPDELSQFIFYPGFSTRQEISEISGRGVGMDVVKENIQNLKGVIRVASEKGQGTTFTIRIPLTLAAVRALLFTVGGQTYAIALNEIGEIIRLDPENILGPNQDALRIKDEVLPLFHMADLLGTRKSGAEPVSPGEYPITLVVETGGRRGTLVIDTLVGQKEIVIKSLGSHLRYVKGVSGATIMGDGSVIPILNIDELLWSQTKMLAKTHTDRELIIEKPLNIMVVDDSVSIRQVVSRLMKDQGWKVLTAKDGIDALDRLSESRPDLIVLDIEMPRMNGYEFLGALKAQAGFEDIPVVMLTSRTVAKHRDKAKALGAKGFIVKPYDDDEFVRLILKLTGRGSG